MVMVYVPEGEFTMGSENLYENGVSPPHTVYLDAYWIDKTEVTNTMFETFVNQTGYLTDAEKIGWSYVAYPEQTIFYQITGANWLHPQGPSSDLTDLSDHPVVNVSWFDAQAYCEWADARLPSEAEWEKAARGPDGRTYPWGNQMPTGNLMNFADANLNVGWQDLSNNDGYEFTAPVGSYPAGKSPFEALDMAGNVEEWVNDWWDKTYYSQSPSFNPSGPVDGLGRIMRGGSWQDAAAPIFYRMMSPPHDRYHMVGFRCVLAPP
jgi:serine/threonine-protein kinase